MMTTLNRELTADFTVQGTEFRVYFDEFRAGLYWVTVSAKREGCIEQSLQSSHEVLDFVKNTVEAYFKFPPV
jgi:hypothetical protein